MNQPNLVPVALVVLVAALGAPSVAEEIEEPTSTFRLAAPYAAAYSYPEYFWLGQTVSSGANAQSGFMWAMTNAVPTGQGGPCVGVRPACFGEASAYIFANYTLPSPATRVELDAVFDVGAYKNVGVEFSMLFFAWHADCDFCGANSGPIEPDMLADSLAFHLEIANTGGGSIPAGTLRIGLNLQAVIDGAEVAYLDFEGTLVHIDGRVFGSEPLPEHGIVLAPESQTRTVPPRGSATYTINVVNTGTREDTFLFSATGARNGWTTSLSPENLTLPPGGGATVELRVNAAQSGSLTVTVTGESRADPRVSASATAQTKVQK